MMPPECFEFKPIGVVHSSGKYRSEAPRQGVFSECGAEIELFREYGGDALTDLAGFSRIWVIFCFHLNLGHPWKPKVRPPFPAGGPCRSLWATRSPYRVNPIGLSCVELSGISGCRLFLRRSDMLDGTPVLDIKPYIPAADAFPDAIPGWLAGSAEKAARWQLEFTPRFLAQAEFLRSRGAPDLVNFAEVQLSGSPFDSSRKRVRELDDGRWMLACRTWRIIFTVRKEDSINVEEAVSDYDPSELAEGAADRYRDKDLHREYAEWNR